MDPPQQSWVEILAQTLTGFVTLMKVLNFSETQFPRV